MSTKQRLLALLISAALACAACGQAPNEGPKNANEGPNGNGPGQSVAAAPGQPAAGQPAPGQVDPPARVARLANVSGNVSFTPAGENEWVQAQLNRPVVTGDKLWTADGARAELQVGSSTVRLDYKSNFDFLNLNDSIAQMELTQGTLNLDVWRLNGDETYEVDTPTIAFIASRVGDYRIDVDPQGRFTTVTARRGGGEAVGEGGKRITIEEGQSIRFNDSALKDYQVNVGTPDDFDLYCTQRKERHERAQTRNYVSENVVGYEDLDDYGRWESAPEYGHVWYPTTVAVDWAPYHDGRWVWVDPWGWSWVDAAPWGFAPFHYGRWAYIGSRWGWVPGPVDIAPVYAPALVAFVGGGGFGLSVSVGGPIGWFALGPGDVYFPGYGASSGYFSRVNVGNTYVNQTVVNNYYGAWSTGSVNYSQMTFANRNAPRALTAVPTSTFASGQPVATSAVAVNRTTMANARVLPRAMVAPTRTSLTAGSGRAEAIPPASAVSRAVVAAHTPPVQPSFAQRQSLLQKSAGQPLSTTQMRSLGTQANGRSSAGTTAANNVRVVGSNGGTAGPTGSIAQQPTSSNAATTTNNGQGPQAANGRGNDRATANTNAAPAHVRSADFAHSGAAQGRGAGRESTAQQSAQGQTNNQRASANNGATRDTTRGNLPETTTAPGRERSSNLAHGPSGQSTNAINRGAQTSRSTAAKSRGDNRSSSPAFSRATQDRAPARVEHSAPMNKRPAYTQRAPEQHAPIQHSAPQRAPMQAPPQSMVQHGPPPQQQRGPGPGPQRQTSVARQAPQHAAPHGNGKEKDKNGGGGG